MMAHYAIFSGSDRGLVRRNNEDSIGALMFEQEGMALALVADGVGGHAGGEVASQLAVDVIRQHVAPAVARAESLAAGDELWLQHLLLDALHEANAAIVAEQKQQPELSSMATTVVAALFNHHQMMLAHMGDSRCYRWREKQLQLLTRDHTVAQQLIDQGNFTAEQIRHMPYHHVLSRALGLDAFAEIDGHIWNLLPGDLYLLCSDGLTNCLEDEQILDILNGGDDIHRCGEELIASANDAGGVDNISVVLVRVVD